jgi:hypothetical protein
VGTAYSASAAATGALGTTTYALASGALPASGHLVLNTSTGAITGTPYAADAGTYTFTVGVTDQYGDTATSGSLSIKITAPTITFPSSLGGANVGTAYSGSAAASGTVGATTYSLASGALPVSGDLVLNTSTGAITGTPKAADVGTSTFTVKVVDAYGDTATSGSLSITVTGPTITFSSTLPGGTVGSAYAGSVTASGTIGTVTYSLASGALPASGHLSFNASTGAITGTPYAADAGTSNFTVKVVDQYGDTATSGSLSIVITAPTITFATPTASANVGVAYASSAAATGTVGTTTYSLASGALPVSGHLAFNTSTGGIAGTPYFADAGAYSFKVSVTDQYGDTATSGNLSITVTAPTITFATPIATATVGTAYSSSAAASGAAGTTTYSLASGALPVSGDLALSTTTGAITGTPFAGDVGTYNFKIGVTDAYGDTATSGTLTIVISSPAITFTTPTATATVGTLYSGSAAASGAAGTTTYTLASGALPASGDLVLNASTGAINGTPKAGDVGPYNFTIKVTDHYGDTATSGTLSIVVGAAPAITFGAAPTLTATDGVQYSSAVAATGGAGTLTYSLVSSGDINLPSNFALNSSTGAVSGTPSNLSSFTFQVQAADAYGDTSALKSYTVTVSPGAAAKLVFTVEPPANGTAGSSFSAGVLVEDVNGFQVTSSTASVTITSTAPGVAGTTTVSASGGVAAFTNLILTTSGTYTLQAASAGLTGATSSSITIGAGTASKLAFTSGPPTGGAAGAAFSATVQVQDAYGNPVTSSTAPVTITSTAPGVAGTTTVPASGGVAAFTNLILTTSGTYTLQAASAGLTGATSSSITIGAGIPSKVVFTSGPPSNGTAGTPFSTTAQIQDGNGNVVTTSTAPVTISSTASGVTGTLTVNAVNGVATFSNLILNTSGTYALIAASPGLTSGASTLIVIGPGQATQLVFTTEPPANGTAGTAFGATVQVQDAYGNRVTSSSASVTIALPASVTGTTTVSAVSGAANFTNLILNTSGTYTLTAISSGLTNGASTSIVIGAGTATKLVFTAEPPANVTDGNAFGATVQVQDANNNLVTTNNTASVTISTTAPGVTGTTTITVINGVANFTNLILNTSGPYTLTAASAGLASANSTTVTASNQLIISPTVLPSADDGSTYSFTLSATGGSGSGYTFTTTGASTLSNFGLSLASNGLISGPPTGNGTATFTAKVTDGANNTATQALSIAVYGALSLPAPDPGSLPSTGQTNQTYAGSIQATGGTGTYQWSVNGTVVTGAGVSLGNGTLTATVSFGGNVLDINGAPSSTSPVSFNVKLTDTAANNVFIAQGPYTITISNPIAVSLPPPSSSVPGPATVSQPYTTSITALNGVPPYTWTVNGQPTTGPGYSLGDGITAGSTGNTLTFTGLPTTAETIGPFTVKVVDSTLPASTNASNSYSIVVNPNGGTIGGQFTLQNYCYNGNSTLPVNFTVTLTNTSTNATIPGTTNSTGGFSFSGVPPGTYTITPSIAGAASLFYPASYTGVSVSNGTNLSSENFNAQVGYTVSGTVSYSGSQTGQTYLILNGGCSNGNGSLGTGLLTTQTTGNGSFTIHGVQPGSYTLTAWMDPLGNAVQNAIDPTGSTTSGAITVSNANVTGLGITMADPSPFTTPTTNPTINAIVPNSQGVLIEFNPSTKTINGNQVEDANQYVVQWSTNPALGGGPGGGQFACTATGGTCPSHTFAANGDKGAWVLNNTTVGASTFQSGTTYYFQTRSFNTLISNVSNQHPSGWCDYDSSSSNGCSPTPTVTSSFTGVTIGTPSCSTNCTAVSSSVTIPSTLTCPTNPSQSICAGAPLYLGLIQLDPSSGNPTGIYMTEITSPVVGVNSFPQPITVPNGSNYGVIGILDQLNNGGFGVGAVSNTNNLSGNLNIGGGTQTVPGITLPATNSVAIVATQYNSYTCSGCSSTSTSYQLNFEVQESNKLPVAVTLTSGPNVINNAGTVAIDMAGCTNCGNAEFDYTATLAGGAPSLGPPPDTYGFTVKYSDGSTETGTVVPVTAFGSTGAIVGPNDLPTNLSPGPTTAGVGTEPTFTWTWPAAGLTSNTYYYVFSLSSSGVCVGNNCNDVWQVPNGNSNSNGFTYTQDQGSPYGGTSTTGSLVWNTDPSGSGSTATGPLTTSPATTYNWQIQVNDSSNYPSNSASASVYFVTQ